MQCSTPDLQAMGMPSLHSPCPVEITILACPCSLHCAVQFDACFRREVGTETPACAGRASGALQADFSARMYPSSPEHQKSDYSAVWRRCGLHVRLGCLGYWHGSFQAGNAPGKPPLGASVDSGSWGGTGAGRFCFAGVRPVGHFRPQDRFSAGRTCSGIPQPVEIDSEALGCLFLGVLRERRGPGGAGVLLRSGK